MRLDSNFRRGVTLVELLVALAIITVLSTAVATILGGAAKTSSYVNAETDAVSQVENAFRRIMHNLRTAASLTSPADTTPSNTLSLVTQDDPASGTPYTVTYSLSGTNLVENDSRYNAAGNTPNVIATNVTAFSITRLTTAAPHQVRLSLTMGGGGVPINRSLTVYCRNLTP